MEELSIKIDRVSRGETTVTSNLQSGEGYEEFWRRRADEYGLSVNSEYKDTTGNGENES